TALLLIAGPAFAAISLSNGYFLVTGEVIEISGNQIMVKIETGNILTVDSLPNLKKGDQVNLKIHISGTKIDSAVLLTGRQD
ncbi:hypothetical protein QUF72_21580, partial [Desulfobacterales bacterium HSG2]|nr:hypothetical protein [Desulfobacterales bacterium HSG2]